MAHDIKPFVALSGSAWDLDYDIISVFTGLIRGTLHDINVKEGVFGPKSSRHVRIKK